MKTKLIMTITVATALSAGVAMARDANTGPVYPNSASNQSYADQPIQDHNNRAPRYPATATGKAPGQVRYIEDHNNRSPRYPAMASANSADVHQMRHAHHRHVVHAHHRHLGSAS
jgi:hypothetical protein